MSVPINFRPIDYGSSAYRASLLLRERVLRAPLGKTLSDADTAGEDNQSHFGLFREDVLVACVVIKPLEDNCSVKLRQMAVAESFQGDGLGKALVSAVEAVMERSGIEIVGLSARLSAQGFYLRLGYRSLGAPYLEQGIPHIRMQKRL